MPAAGTEEFGEGITNEVIKYWVEQGFDSDQLVRLGPVKSIEFICRVAKSHPKLKNDLYHLHVRSYLSEITRVNSIERYNQVKSKIPGPIRKLRTITLQ